MCVWMADLFSQAFLGREGVSVNGGILELIGWKNAFPGTESVVSVLV